MTLPMRNDPEFSSLFIRNDKYMTRKTLLKKSAYCEEYSGEHFEFFFHQENLIRNISYL